MDRIKDTLNDIAKELLCYWLSHNLRQDFKVFEQFVKISSVLYDIDVITDTKDDMIS